MAGQESKIQLKELKDEAVRVLRHAGKTRRVVAVFNAPTPRKLIAEIGRAILQDNIQEPDRGDLKTLMGFAEILAGSW